MKPNFFIKLFVILAGTAAHYPVKFRFYGTISFENDAPATLPSNSHLFVRIYQEPENTELPDALVRGTEVNISAYEPAHPIYYRLDVPVRRVSRDDEGTARLVVALNMGWKSDGVNATLQEGDYWANEVLDMADGKQTDFQYDLVLTPYYQ